MNARELKEFFNSVMDNPNKVSMQKFMEELLDRMIELEDMIDNKVEKNEEDKQP